jgi:hypothetical protein
VSLNMRAMWRLTIVDASVANRSQLILARSNRFHAQLDSSLT